MIVWAAGSPRAGDCDLDFESLEVNTERRVGASLRNEGGEGKERVGLGERGRGNVGRKWQVRIRDKYDHYVGVFGLLELLDTAAERKGFVFDRENTADRYLELAKRLFGRFALRHTEHVESHRLGQRSTLACTHILAYTRFAGHSIVPTVTTSPISTRNAGETCTARFLCRFSYRSSIVNLSDGLGHIITAKRTVFGNVVQVITPDDRSAGHFCRHDLACQNATPNRHIASEGAFFVCKKHLRPLSAWFGSPSNQPTDIGPIDGFWRCFEAKSNILIPSPLLGSNLLSTWSGLRFQWKVHGCMHWEEHTTSLGVLK